MTKTQLIDMAIDKLGENPDWDVYGFVSISTIENTTYGFGEFDICHERHVNGVYWQLVCTREEFEQRVAERKAISKPTNEWWDYENNVMLCIPPVGTHCEFAWGNQVDWFEAVVLPDGCAVYKWHGEWKFTKIVLKNRETFRPLPYKPALTERQQAGLKLWGAINWRVDYSDDDILQDTHFEDYCRPFDQGLLK